MLIGLIRIHFDLYRDVANVAKDKQAFLSVNLVFSLDCTL